MKKNMFDKGYEIIWVGHCRAKIQRIPDLPIAEIYKEKFIDDLSGKKSFYWNVRPLIMTDEKLDDILPKNWRDKYFMGFQKFHEINAWLRMF